MNRKVFLYIVLLFCFQQVMAEPIRFSYDAKRDSLTFTGEGTLEQKHVKQALAQYPNTKIVYVGGNVARIGDKAFNNCNNLETIIFSSSVRSNGTTPICNCKKLSKVVLPDDERGIYRLLSNCPNLESFVIPDSVWWVVELSSSCPFKTLHIGKNLREVRFDFGVNSDQLSSITVSPGNKFFFSQDGVLFYYTDSMYYCEQYKDKLRSINFCEGTWKYLKNGGVGPSILVYPPEKKDTSFYYNYPILSDGGGYSPDFIRSNLSNKYLKEMRLGKDFKGFYFDEYYEAYRINRGGFNPPNLVRFMVDDSNELFSAQDGVLFCHSGHDLVAYPAAKKGSRYMIPSHVLKIEKSAFDGCQFDTLVFPETIKEVSQHAVLRCNNLRCVEMHWQNPYEILFSCPFYGINTADVTLKVPKGTKDLYIDLFNTRMGYQFKVEEDSSFHAQENDASIRGKRKDMIILNAQDFRVSFQDDDNLRIVLSDSVAERLVKDPYSVVLKFEMNGTYKMARGYSTVNAMLPMHACPNSDYYFVGDRLLLFENELVLKSIYKIK